jgi:hypothetical protein
MLIFFVFFFFINVLRLLATVVQICVIILLYPIYIFYYNYVFVRVVVKKGDFWKRGVLMNTSTSILYSHGL